MRKAVLVLAVMILVGGAVIVGWRELRKPTVAAQGITLFTSSECIQCRQVETFITDNAIDTKLTLVRKDISIPINLAALNAAARVCQIESTQGIGLPLLLVDGKCYVGGSRVEGYFRQRTDLNTLPSPSNMVGTSSSQLIPTITVY